jgi:hypothetical protein
LLFEFGVNLLFSRIGLPGRINPGQTFVMRQPRSKINLNSIFPSAHDRRERRLQGGNPMASLTAEYSG